MFALCSDRYIFCVKHIWHLTKQLLIETFIKVNSLAWQENLKTEHSVVTYFLMNLLELQCMSVYLFCYYVNFDWGDSQCTHRMCRTVEGEGEFKQMVRLSLGMKTE